jgi:hypothetical protein
MKATILEQIHANPVILIRGNTGCGKTTQVCQYLLDDFISSGQGAYCNIICTQPRYNGTVLGCINYRYRIFPYSPVIYDGSVQKSSYLFAPRIILSVIKRRRRFCMGRNKIVPKWNKRLDLIGPLIRIYRSADPDQWEIFMNPGHLKFFFYWRSF